MPETQIPMDTTQSVDRSSVEYRRPASVARVPPPDSVKLASGPDHRTRRDSGTPWPDAALKPAASRVLLPPLVAHHLGATADRWQQLTGRALRLHAGYAGAAGRADARARFEAWRYACTPSPMRLGGRFKSDRMSTEHVHPVGRSLLDSGFGVRLDPVAMCERPELYRLLDVLMQDAGFRPAAVQSELASPCADTWTYLDPFVDIIEALNDADRIRWTPLLASFEPVPASGLRAYLEAPAPMDTLAELLCYLTGTGSGTSQVWGLCWARLMLDRPHEVDLPARLPPTTRQRRGALVAACRSHLGQLDGLSTGQIQAGLLLAMLNREEIGLDGVAALSIGG